MMRIAVVVILTFIGVCWLTMLNGQEFTNCLGCIACLCVAGLISLKPAATTTLPKLRRVLWFEAALLLFFFASVLATVLPHLHNIDWDKVVRNMRERNERMRQDAAKHQDPNTVPPPTG